MTDTAARQKEADAVAKYALRKGTTKCPRDGEILHWEQFGGSRVYQVYGGGDAGVGGMSYYKARCPKCATNWNVRRGRYTKEDV